MLILCTGPDTWHARKKMRELVTAFKQKFDSAGLAVEVLEQANIKDIANQLGMPSFFSSKKMMITEGLFQKAPVADVRLLVKRLQMDGEQTILVDFETEEAAEKTMKELKSAELHQYSYPLLSESKFLAWAKGRARDLGVGEAIAKEVAEKTMGDIWLAEQELMKKAADPKAQTVAAEEADSSAFVAIEGYLKKRPSWREEIDSSSDEQAPSLLVSQARSAVRVSFGAVSGMHPYQVKKLSGLPKGEPQACLEKTIRSFAATRTGACTQKESETLL